MRVVPARTNDILPWLMLAAETEALFGPMRYNPAFLNALYKHIERGTAFCIREDDGASGAPLMGGMLIAATPPRYELDWIAVARRWRRHGVGRALLDHLLAQIEPPAELTLLTFGETVPGSDAARRFYAATGFVPGEPGPANAQGKPMQVYRRYFGDRPSARVVLQHHDRFLLAQHHYMRPENDGKWSIPGGGIEPGDPNPKSALRREMQEELQLDVGSSRFLGRYTHRNRLHYLYHMHTDTTRFTFDPAEIKELAWFTHDEVRAHQQQGRLFAPFMLDAIQAAREVPYL